MESFLRRGESRPSRWRWYRALYLHGAERLEPRVLFAVVFHEDFEGYEGEAEFLAVWQRQGAPAYTFDPAFGRDSGRSVKLVDPGGGNGTTNRYVAELPAPLT